MIAWFASISAILGRKTHPKNEGLVCGSRLSVQETLLNRGATSRGCPSRRWQGSCSSCKHVRKVPFDSEHYVADDALIRVYTIIKLLSTASEGECRRALLRYISNLKGWIPGHWQKTWKCITMTVLLQPSWGHPLTVHPPWLRPDRERGRLTSHNLLSILKLEVPHGLNYW